MSYLCCVRLSATSASSKAAATAAATSSTAAGASEQAGHPSLALGSKVIQVVGEGQHRILRERRGSADGLLIERYSFADRCILFQEIEDRQPQFAVLLFEQFFCDARI